MRYRYQPWPAALETMPTAFCRRRFASRRRTWCGRGPEFCSWLGWCKTGGHPPSRHRTRDRPHRMLWLERYTPELGLAPRLPRPHRSRRPRRLLQPQRPYQPHRPSPATPATRHTRLRCHVLFLTRRAPSVPSHNTGPAALPEPG